MNSSAQFLAKYTGWGSNFTGAISGQMFTGSLPLFILTRIRDILAPEKDLKAKFTLKRKINARLKKKVHLFIYWSLQKKHYTRSSCRQLSGHTTIQTQFLSCRKCQWTMRAPLQFIENYRPSAAVEEGTCSSFIHTLWMNDAAVQFLWCGSGCGERIPCLLSQGVGLLHSKAGFTYMQIGCGFNLFQFT